MCHRYRIGIRIVIRIKLNVGLAGPGQGIEKNDRGLLNTACVNSLSYGLQRLDRCLLRGLAGPTETVPSIAIIRIQRSAGHDVVKLIEEYLPPGGLVFGTGIVVVMTQLSTHGDGLGLDQPLLSASIILFALSISRITSARVML